MSFTYGKMSSNLQHYFRVEYPCRLWLFGLIWFYVLIPIIFIPIVLWIRGNFSIISCVGLILLLQLLWTPRFIKDIWVPYAVSIEEVKIVVYTRVGKRIKENSIKLNDLGVKFNKRRNSLTLWEREENRTPPSKMFYLSKVNNWNVSTIREIVHSLLSISHYSIHYEEV